MKRAADVMNPEWYRDFYHGNGVQRYRTLLSLARITEGRDYPFSQEGKWTFEWRTYDAFYRGYIKERLVDGIPEMPERGETRMYEPVVRAYFGKPLAEDEMPEGGLDELLTDAMIDRAWEGRPGIPSIDGDPPF